MISKNEPTNITPDVMDYASTLTRAFDWYNREKDKKDARQYIRAYLGKSGKLIDKVPDSKIILTFGWMARMLLNGCVFGDRDVVKFNEYIQFLTTYEPEPVNKVSMEEVVSDKPSVRDYLEENIKEYIGELESILDDVLLNKKEFNLFNDLKARNLSTQYASYITPWLNRKAGEFIFVHETDDKDIKTGYSNLGTRKLTNVLTCIKQWHLDLEKFTQYKKANRKPRVKKIKPPGVQVSKLKYKKECTALNIKSIRPVDIIGASQLWVYNTRYKKLAVYRTDSKDGIQVKGSSLQNYDPAQCEQKSIKKPDEVLAKVLEGGKLVLRKLLTDLNTKSYPVTGRINEECLLIRAIK